MTAHSSILGGSNAARLLACPASFQEALRAPVPDVESPYAAEGTLLHEVIANRIQRGDPADVPMLTDEQEAVIRKALAMLADLKQQLGGKFRIMAVEQTLPFPGVSGSFGTVDLVLASKTCVVVPDWKFGAGVPVKALYDLGDSDALNPQGAFYAICARARWKHLFKGRQIAVAIIQPRLDNLSVAMTDNEELDDFEKALTAAYLEALGRNPFREKGEHCRFATCRATCALWTGPVLDLSAIDPHAALKASVTPTDYAAYLSRALEMAEIAEGWCDEIRRQAHVYLEDGGLVAGWKLVPKRATRKWREDANVDVELRALGAVTEDIWTEPELRSVKQCEDRLKKRGIVLPDDLHHAVSSGTTIAHGDDRRPETTHATVTVELRKALVAL